MKKDCLKRIVVTACIFSMLILPGFYTAAAEAKTMTLTYATNTAPTGLRGIAEKGFLDEIERLSEGKIKIRAYWGQSLLKGKEILKGVKDGTVNMGHVNINYYPNRLVKNSAITLMQRGPVKYENRMWVYDTMYETIPKLTDEITKYNQKIIYQYSVSPFAGTFNKPVTSLADYKGLRIRASSRWTLSVLKGTGAIPVSVPWGDCYMALQTNAIEGVFTNLDAIHRVKLDEVAPNLLVFKELWVANPYLITVNLKKWNKLPKETQEIIEKAAINSRKNFAITYRKMFGEIIAAQKKAGYKVAFAQKEDIDAWMNLKEVQEIKAQWIREVNQASGKTDAADVLNKIENIVVEGIKKDN